MVKPIVAFGSDILRKKCAESVPGPETGKCIQDLKDTIEASENGVGLAAPQINYDLRILVTRLFTDIPIQVYINPKIVKERDTESGEEGCLSIPGIYYTFSNMRAKRITVEYQDETFTKQKVKLSGREATVFQHELDHLNGILFIDYLSVDELRELRPELEKIEAGNVNVKYAMVFADGHIESVFPLAVGATGYKVRQVQKYLNRRYSKALLEDGTFGKYVEEALLKHEDTKQITEERYTKITNFLL